MSLKQGVETLGFWWLQGHKPVDKNHAQARAKVCLTCPKNLPHGLFEKLTLQAAMLVRAAMTLRHRMRLKLEEDPKLLMCEACGCEMRLKVWCPKEVLAKDGKPGYFDELWEGCWLRKEL